MTFVQVMAVFGIFVISFVIGAIVGLKMTLFYFSRSTVTDISFKRCADPSCGAVHCIVSTEHSMMKGVDVWHFTTTQPFADRWEKKS